MHFYVDETGQTGRNLFDKTQPVLSYGVLSSDANLDKVAEADLAVIRKTLGVQRLHAAELGLHRLSDLVDTLLVLQKKHRIRFDIWQVVKRDHAIISFFDQVFDQGMNPAVPWSAYWTPLRYPLLLNLASLFDDELASNAWTARLEAHDERASELFCTVSDELISRTAASALDHRSKPLITDALNWASANFEQLGYNCKTNKERLRIMPNMIGFQSVLHGICSRLGAPERKASIIVDQQSQFNTTQRELNEFYYQIRDMPWELGPGLPVMNMKNMPAEPLVFQSGTKSAGLELVDIYLWTFKRFMEDKALTKPLSRLVYTNLKTARTNSVSIQSVASRFKELLGKLPVPSAEIMRQAQELRDFDEARRMPYVVSGSPD